MSPTNTPEEKRFLDILETYGAHEKHWPAEESAAMNLWLARSENARKNLQKAQELDRFLEEEFQEITAPAHLFGAVLRDAEKLYSPNKWYHNLLKLPSFKPASGLIAAVIIGVFAGWYAPNITLIDQNLELDDISLSDSVLEWEAENEKS